MPTHRTHGTKMSHGMVGHTSTPVLAALSPSTTTFPSATFPTIVSTTVSFTRQFKHSNAMVRVHRHQLFHLFVAFVQTFLRRYGQRTHHGPPPLVVRPTPPDPTPTTAPQQPSTHLTLKRQGPFPFQFTHVQTPQRSARGPDGGHFSVHRQRREMAAGFFVVFGGWHTVYDRTRVHFTNQQTATSTDQQQQTVRHTYTGPHHRVRVLPPHQQRRPALLPLLPVLLCFFAPLTLFRQFGTQIPNMHHLQSFSSLMKIQHPDMRSVHHAQTVVAAPAHVGLLPLFHFLSGRRTKRGHAGVRG